MAREKKRFLCSECGAEHSLWEGRCNVCGNWNTLREFKEKKESSRLEVSGDARGPVQLSQVNGDREERFTTGMKELDRTLGGGLVVGSVVLLGGDPGIGKSTLLLEAAANMALNREVLYVSGEESLTQIKLRATRLEVSSDAVWVLAETRLETIQRLVEEREPAVLIIDSIQTVASDEIAAGSGSVSQVRECAARLIQLAKQRGVSLFLVGHVTKDGQIAGPKLLEHMVDTVLYFEGERSHQYRILRTVKNRFGPANEIGVFEMGESGLREVDNPSELFLSQRVKGQAGSVVYAGMEGTRPVLVEIQSLVAPTPLPQPRRTTLGVDVNRLAMLVAVLEKRLGLGLYDRDIFLNVAGGFRVSEPAADLAVVLSLFSGHRNLALDGGLLAFGEVGLAGEIRSVGHVATRLREAAKLGFTRCMVPGTALKGLPEDLGISLIPVNFVSDAIHALLPREA
ncbi:MAG: DNA repair protein RadA [Magnetococcales bacterium]|nr:DNA repair protein RadA [Magnetococcales bacterium]NGZ27042.1 DNA repair protein RadA [Magnetococcales bacterium]